jgi:hypothetical protein
LGASSAMNFKMNITDSFIEGILPSSLYKNEIIDLPYPITNVELNYFKGLKRNLLDQFHSELAN